MLFNKNIVLEIIRTHFGDEIELQTAGYVMKLENFELEDFFDDYVDYALLDVIDEISVEQFRVEEKKENICSVEGILTVVSLLEGYVYWEDEELCVGEAEASLVFLFRFSVKDDEYFDFKLSYIYG